MVPILWFHPLLDHGFCFFHMNVKFFIVLLFDMFLTPGCSIQESRNHLQDLGGTSLATTPGSSIHLPLLSARHFGHWDSIQLGLIAG